MSCFYLKWSFTFLTMTIVSKDLVVFAQPQPILYHIYTTWVLDYNVAY